RARPAAILAAPSWVRPLVPRFPVRRSSRKQLPERLPQLRWAGRHLNSSRFHCCDLALGIALAAGDNRSSVAHAASGRGGAPSNEADNGLLAAALGLISE